MINYTLPGLTEFLDIDLFFADMFDAHPDMFHEGIRIDSIYGGFAGSRICGGRNNIGRPLDLDMVRKLVRRYNDMGIGCNGTFTNQFATRQMLEESEYDRGILQILGESGLNGAIVYSDDVYGYIEDHGLNLKLIGSTTLGLNTVEATDAALQKYDRAVLDYNFTKDESFISSLCAPEKLEVMVNEYCTLNCPYRNEHYATVSRDQLAGRRSGFQCRHEPAPQAYGFLNGLINGDVFLRNEQVRHYNEDLGVGYFKIVGRELARYDIVDSYLYYLIQPDCWYEVRDFLIHHNYL